MHPASGAPHLALPLFSLLTTSSHGLFWPCPLKTPNMLATPRPVLHEALALQRPHPGVLALLTPTSPALSPGIMGRSTTSLAYKGGGGPLRAWLPWVHQPCLPPAPSSHNPRTRGAALLSSWTKHKGMPCLARVCPRKPPPWNTDSWQFLHGWLPTWRASISPGKGSQGARAVR